MEHPTLLDTPKHGSLLELIRTQAQESVEGQTVDLPILGWSNPELWARYRFMPIAETQPLGASVRSEFKDDTDRFRFSMIAVMIEACEGIYAREQGTRDLVSLEELLDDRAGPVRYDDRLERAIGRDPSGSARGAVHQAFKDNDYAAVEHGQLLQRWMNDTTKTVEQLLGEA
jgi:hypothetical protein